jgi:peptide deformylase
MELRLWPHADLKKVCPPVNVESDGEFALQLDAMKKVLTQSGGVGLAANQLGIIKRMLVAVQSRGDAPLHFVNPKVVGFGGKWVDVREGCLSVPGFFENVKRNTSVTVEHFDLSSKATVVQSFTGLLGHVLQHEIEHLDGVMFVDKLKPAARDQLRAFLRKNPPRARR